VIIDYPIMNIRTNTGYVTQFSVFRAANGLEHWTAYLVGKKLKTLPLLPLLHSLSTDEAHWHTGVAALLGHTGHTIKNGMSGVSELKILVKIIKCNTLQFSEVNVLFSYW